MAASPAQTDRQTPNSLNASSHDDLAVKVDYERGTLHQKFPPKSSQPITMCCGLLRFAALLSLILLVQRFWPLPSLLHGWESERVVDLDDICPQVEAPTPRYKALLASLDEEFGSNEFQFKAYESLGGAVRIP